MPAILAAGRFFQGADTTAVCAVVGIAVEAENSTEGNIAESDIGVAAAAGVEVEAEVEAGVELEVAVAASAMAVDRVRMPERTMKGSWRQAEA